MTDRPKTAHDAQNSATSEAAGPGILANSTTGPGNHVPAPPTTAHGYRTCVECSGLDMFSQIAMSGDLIAAVISAFFGK